MKNIYLSPLLSPPIHSILIEKQADSFDDFNETISSEAATYEKMDLIVSLFKYSFL